MYVHNIFGFCKISLTIMRVLLTFFLSLLLLPLKITQKLIIDRYTFRGIHKNCAIYIHVYLDVVESGAAFSHAWDQWCRNIIKSSLSHLILLLKSERVKRNDTIAYKSWDQCEMIAAGAMRRRNGFFFTLLFQSIFHSWFHFFHIHTVITCSIVLEIRRWRRKIFFVLCQWLCGASLYTRNRNDKNLSK